MNKNIRLLSTFAAVLLVLINHPLPAKGARVVVTWFVGLGTGAFPEQFDPQLKLVDEFNKRQDKIELKVHFDASDNTPENHLKSSILAGDAPDIVGPVGFTGANAFSGEWLDLKPLIKEHDFNLKQYPQILIDLYDEDGKMYGIPFAIYPGLIYYNIDLFDKAGLAYPPSKFGTKYMLDGNLIDWDWDTIAEIAKRLTLDTNGNNANSPDFDPAKTVQFGFIHQWDTMRSDFNTFGGGTFINGQGKVVIPEHWREAARWLWNGIWKDHFIPNTSYQNEYLLDPSSVPSSRWSNAFTSGNVAMARSMLWYTCCLTFMKARWDLAVMPSYKGNIYAPLDADTFRILKDSKNPDAAFTVLTDFLLDDAAPELLKIYFGYPARPDLQDQLLKMYSNRYPTVKHWEVVAPSMRYAVAPSHDSNYPNFSKGQSRFDDFRVLIYSDKGKDIDLDKELDKLQADLQWLIQVSPTEIPPTPTPEQSSAS